MDGKFTLNVNEGSILSISFIGYVTQEIKYTGQTSLNIKLVEDTQKLDEVVVTAMGIKKEKRALSYAMSELKSERYPVSTGSKHRKILYMVRQPAYRFNKQLLVLQGHQNPNPWYQLRRRK